METRARRRAAFRLFLILGGLSAFGAMSIDLYLPALPQIGHGYHAGASAVQLSLTTFLAGLGLGQLVSGAFSDQLGRRKPLVAGLGTYVVASLLCAVAPSVYALAGLRLLQGAAGATGVVIARAVVRDLYTGSEASRYFSRLFLVVGLAPILAPSLGSALLHVMSWRGLFVVLAGIGLLLLGAALAWLPETLPPERRRSGGLADVGRTMKLLARDRVFTSHMLVLGCSYGTVYAYIGGSPFLFEEIHHASPAVFSVLFGANAIGIVAVAQANGTLVGRVMPSRLLLAGCIVAAGGAALFLVTTVSGVLGLAGAAVPLLLIVSCIGMIGPNATALALTEQGHVAGSAAAVLGVAQYAAGGLIPPLVGVAGTHSALPMALVMATLVGLAALALVGVARPALRRAAAARQAEPG